MDISRQIVPRGFGMVGTVADNGS